MSKLDHWRAYFSSLGQRIYANSDLERSESSASGIEVDSVYVGNTLSKLEFKAL